LEFYIGIDDKNISDFTASYMRRMEDMMMHCEVRLTSALDGLNLLDYYFYSWAEVRLNPLVTSVTVGLIVAAPDDDMRVEQLVEWELAEETRRKSSPAPLCPPQIPHILT
jgi:hypothetical protein